MSSTYSTNLALELPGTGEQAGNWGATNNLNIGTLLEQAISGYVTQAVATGTDTTLTMSQGASATARNMFIELTGTGGASTNLIVPANKKLYFIYNNTSAGQVTVKVSGQTGVSVPNGAKILLVSNGTDIVNAQNYIATLTVGGALAAGSASLTTQLPVSSGGTGNNTLTANNVLLGNGTSAVQFVAPGANGNVLASNGTTWVATSGVPAGSIVTTNFSILESGGKLVFKYGTTTIASLDSSGNLITLGSHTAGGTP